MNERGKNSSNYSWLCANYCARPLITDERGSFRPVKIFGRTRLCSKPRSVSSQSPISRFSKRTASILRLLAYLLSSSDQSPLIIAPTSAGWGQSSRIFLDDLFEARGGIWSWGGPCVGSCLLGRGDGPSLCVSPVNGKRVWVSKIVSSETQIPLCLMDDQQAPLLLTERGSVSNKQACC